MASLHFKESRMANQSLTYLAGADLAVLSMHLEELTLLKVPHLYSNGFAISESKPGWIWRVSDEGGFVGHCELQIRITVAPLLGTVNAS